VAQNNGTTLYVVDQKVNQYVSQVSHVYLPVSRSSTGIYSVVNLTKLVTKTLVTSQIIRSITL